MSSRFLSSQLRSLLWPSSASASSSSEELLALSLRDFGPDDKFRPQLGSNISYVVAAVVLNERDEVLMMQEAKQSCAGQWYLPAGRMERGESVVEAAEREVEEETGMVFKPDSLLVVETAGANWIRFVVSGDVVHGTLKTPAQADAESLQAKFVGDLEQLTLRASDVNELVRRAKERRLAIRQNLNHHSPQLPLLLGHEALLLRVAIVGRRRETGSRPQILMGERTRAHLPICELEPQRSLHSTLKRFVTHLFNDQTPLHRPHGLLCVEHDGQKGDGLCFNLLVSLRVPVEECSVADKFVWVDVEDEDVLKELGLKLAKNMCLPLNVIR